MNSFLLLTACSLLFGKPMVGGVPQGVEERVVQTPIGLRVETWVEGLEVPWEVAFLDQERALVTERPGRVRLVEGGHLREEPYLSLDVSARGEGGLMGLALHPSFPEEPWIYLMYTHVSGGRTLNRVERFRHGARTATSDRVLLDGIPGARNHNGGRIAFGPDGMLYVTTGENFEASMAQELERLGGKVLRIAPDGSIPEDNPFPGSPVWSYGHRNPQGLAWEPETGTLFLSDHGPSGEFGLRGHDVIHAVVKGGNHGWPLAVGVVERDDLVDPVVLWQETTPPAGMAFWRGRLYVATLRSRALVRLDVRPEGDGWQIESIERLFPGDRRDGGFGRLRAVAVGPDGALYVTTSNRDGRGQPARGDDRILRITVVEEEPQ